MVPRRAWYPAIRSTALRRKPASTTFLGTPVALWRDGSGSARALVDRCPHRNIPLSGGRVRADGCLECPYHGWRFDGGGACRAVPGLDLGPSPARDAVAHPTLERDGFVWLWGDAAAPPVGEPPAFPVLTGRGTGEVVFAEDLEAPLHSALENTLDVPHTAFLHRGIFRGASEPQRLEAVRRRTPEGVEVEYLGEPAGLGPIRPKGLTFEHWDRFLAPATAQVEYRVEGWARITNTVVHLPLSPTRTRAWFVVRFWTRFPARLVRPIVLAQGTQVLRQDARALARQAANVERFGGERFTSTALDLLGPAIWRVLRQAVRAEEAPGDPPEADDGLGDDGRVAFRA